MTAGQGTCSTAFLFALLARLLLFTTIFLPGAGPASLGAEESGAVSTPSPTSEPESVETAAPPTPLPARDPGSAESDGTGQSPSVRGPSFQPARGRMYARTSEELWERLLGVLKEYKVRFKKQDGVAVTDFMRLGNFRGMPAPKLSPGYEPDRIQFHLFVPQRPGPARVYVATWLNARKSVDRHVWYLANIHSAENWLLDQIDASLGEKGNPIPTDIEDRVALARRLMTTSAALEDPCLSKNPPADKTGVEPPVRIALSNIKPPYDTRDQQVRNQGRVMVEAEIQEDGAVSGLEILAPPGPDPPHHLEGAALFAVPFWRYHPATQNGCPVRVYFTVIVDFSMK